MLLDSTLGIWKIMDPLKNVMQYVDPRPINRKCPAPLVTKPAPGNPRDSRDPGWRWGRKRTAVTLCHLAQSFLASLGRQCIVGYHWRKKDLNDGAALSKNSQSNRDNKQDLSHLYGCYFFSYLRTFIWTYFPFHFQLAYERSFSAIILDIWKFGLTLLAIIVLGWIFSTAINLRKQ